MDGLWCCKEACEEGVKPPIASYVSPARPNLSYQVIGSMISPALISLSSFLPHAYEGVQLFVSHGLPCHAQREGILRQRSSKEPHH